MNGIDKITSRVLAEGRAEAEEIIRAAKERAAAIRAEADRGAEQFLKRSAAEGIKEASRRAELILASAETETRKTLLTGKQKLIAKAFSLALDKLLGLEKDGYVSLLARLAAESSETGTEEIILNERDACRLGMELVIAANRIKGSKMTLSSETRPIRGGFILSQGRVEINCALETLVALRKNELSGKVAELLFSEEQGVK